MPMYQPSTVCSAQLPRLLDFSWHCTSHPNGANGVLSKLKLPCMYAWADMFGLACDGLRMLHVSSAWGKSSHQSLMGKLSGTPARIEMKCFLNVLMPTSATFLRWQPGGTNSSWHSSVIHSFNIADTSLSITCFFGARPAFFRRL